MNAPADDYPHADVVKQFAAVAEQVCLFIRDSEAETRRAKQELFDAIIRVLKQLEERKH